MRGDRGGGEKGSSATGQDGRGPTEKIGHGCPFAGWIPRGHGWRRSQGQLGGWAGCYKPPAREGHSSPRQAPGGGRSEMRQRGGGCQAAGFPGQGWPTEPYRRPAFRAADQTSLTCLPNSFTIFMFGKHVGLERMAIIAKIVYCRNCRNCYGHGPYLYRAWREGDRVRWEYLGKAMPEDMTCLRCLHCDRPIIPVAGRRGPAYIHVTEDGPGGAVMQRCLGCGVWISRLRPPERCPRCGGRELIDDHVAEPVRA